MRTLEEIEQRAKELGLKRAKEAALSDFISNLSNEVKPCFEDKSIANGLSGTYDQRTKQLKAMYFAYAQGQQAQINKDKELLRKVKSNDSLVEMIKETNFQDKGEVEALVDALAVWFEE